MKTSKAFTLIEIVVALAIVSIGVVALLTAHRTALVHRQRAWAERVAVRWAGQKLDEIATLKTFPASGGRETVSGLTLHWSGEKRDLEKGLAEWSVQVGWGQKKKEEVRLVTWRREKMDEEK